MTFPAKYILILLLLSITVLTGQVIILQPPENSVHLQDRIGVTIAGKANAPAKLFVNGNFVAENKIRIDGKCDFINVAIPAGPAILTVETIGARNKTYSAQRMIHILGSPEQIKINNHSAEKLSLPSGRRKSEILLTIADEWGFTSENLKTVTISINSGRILNPDEDKVSAGIQLSPDKGNLTLQIESPRLPDDAILVIEAGSGVMETEISFQPPAEKFMLVGSVNASLAVSENTQGTAKVYTPELNFNDIRYKPGQSTIFGERTSVYGNGTVGKDLNLSFSFDSRRFGKKQYFSDSETDSPYPVFGDNSSSFQDGVSSSPLFIRLQKKESFLMAGDFSTDFKTPELATYDRVFNGVSGKIVLKNHAFKTFGTLTGRSQKIDEMHGNGTSGYYYLSENSIFKFSERVILETRDRLHSEKILKQTRLTRNRDYSINYERGTILFKQPVSALDEDNNPVYIIAVYEYEELSEKNSISGIRYSGKWNKIQSGLTLVRESKTRGAYLLYGGDIVFQPAKSFILKTEIAASENPDLLTETRNGFAIKTDLKATPRTDMEFHLYFQKIESGFVNGSRSSSADKGSQKWGADAQWKHQKYGLFKTEYFRKTGLMSDEQTEFTGLGWEKQICKNWFTAFSGETTKFRNPDNEKRESLKLDNMTVYKFSDKLSLKIRNQQNLTSGYQTSSGFTEAGVDYKINPKISVFGFHKKAWNQRNNQQSQVGFSSQVTENTELTGKYEIAGSASEQHNRAVIGLKNLWQATENLSLNFQFESTANLDSLQTPVPIHQALSIAAEYLPENWKISGKYEFRKSETKINHLFTGGAVTSIFHGLTLLSKWELFTESLQSSGSCTETEIQTGIAYRPESHNFYNGLAKVQFISTVDSRNPVKTKYDRLIFSAHHFLKPADRFEFALLTAYRSATDKSDALFSTRTQTWFFSVRPETDVYKKLSAAADFRFILLNPLMETQTALSTEVNYLLGKNLQAGIGYIFRNYSDPDFSNLNYSFNSIYLNLHLKFSESVFDF